MRKFTMSTIQTVSNEVHVYCDCHAHYIHYVYLIIIVLNMSQVISTNLSLSYFQICHFKGISMNLSTLQSQICHCKVISTNLSLLQSQICNFKIISTNLSSLQCQTRPRLEVIGLVIFLDSFYCFGMHCIVSLIVQFI